MVNVVPEKSDLEKISFDIKKGFEETIFEPVSGYLYETIKNSEEETIFKEDLENGNLKFEGTTIKGKFSVEQLKWIEQKNQYYDKEKKGYLITEASLLFLWGKLQNRFLNIKSQIKLFTTSIVKIDIGIEKQPVDSVLKEIEAKAYTKVPKVSVVPNLSDLSDDMYEAIVKSSNDYTEELLNKINNDMNKVDNIKDIKDSISIREAQAQRRADNISEEASYYFGAKARTEIYKKNGATHFVWKLSTSKDKRHSHEKVVGNVYSYENPPILDGKQVLPSQDYGCKCQDEPIFKTGDK